MLTEDRYRRSRMRETCLSGFDEGELNDRLGRSVPYSTGMDLLWNCYGAVFAAGSTSKPRRPSRLSCRRCQNQSAGRIPLMSVGSQ